VVEACGIHFGPVLGARDKMKAVSWNGDGEGTGFVLRGMSGDFGER
jgi:hypothetical protein